jgi:hypothetical protein
LLPLESNAVTKTALCTLEIAEEEIQHAREELIEYMHPLCKEMGETDFPPLQAINHEIPLIDENKGVSVATVSLPRDV